MGYLLDTIHSMIEWIVDALEIILIDAEAQKHYGPALVRFAMSEVKSRETKLGEKISIIINIFSFLEAICLKKLINIFNNRIFKTSLFKVT